MDFLHEYALRVKEVFEKPLKSTPENNGESPEDCEVAKRDDRAGYTTTPLEPCGPSGFGC